MEGLVARPDSAWPSFPFRATAVTPRPFMVPLSNAGAKREVGLVWAEDRAVSPPAERFARFLRTHVDDA